MNIIKFKRILIFFLFIYSPNTFTNSLINNNKETLKDFIKPESYNFNCVKLKDSEFLICEDKNDSISNYVIKNKYNSIIAKYTINCLEGTVSGSRNKNLKEIDKIISNNIIRSCKKLNSEKFSLSESFSLPDSTNKNAELVCSTKSVKFANSEIETCFAKDDSNNYLIRVKDPIANKIFVQQTGNCDNYSLQDSFFNNEKSYFQTTNMIREKVLPLLKNRICGKNEIGLLKRKINRKSNNNPLSNAYLKMAKAKYELRDYIGALKEVNRAIKINPRIGNAYNLRGSIYDDFGYSDFALLDFDRAILLNPNNKDYYLNRANILIENNYYKEALDDYNMIISLGNIIDNEIFLKKGLINIKLNNFDKALNDLNHFLLKIKNNSEAYKNRAIIYLNKGEFDNACLDLENSIRLNDSSAYKLLRYLNSKDSNICKSIDKQSFDNNKYDISDKNMTEDRKDFVCNKNSYIDFDGKRSCFN